MPPSALDSPKSRTIWASGFRIAHCCDRVKQARVNKWLFTTTMEAPACVDRGIADGEAPAFELGDSRPGSTLVRPCSVLRPQVIGELIA